MDNRRDDKSRAQGGITFVPRYHTNTGAQGQFANLLGDSSRRVWIQKRKKAIMKQGDTLQYVPPSSTIKIVSIVCTARISSKTRCGCLQKISLTVKFIHKSTTTTR